MRTLVKIFQQTVWQILGKVVTSFATFATLWLVARNYHEAGTGIFTLTLTYLGIFYVFADFGFNAYVLQKFQILNAKLQIREWQKLLGTRILWSAVLLVLAIGLLPVWPFTTPSLALATAAGSLAIIGSAIFISCNLVFQSRLRYDLSVLASSIGTISGLAILLWLTYIRSVLPVLLLAQPLSWLVTSLGSLLLVRRFLATARPIFDLTYMKKLFQKSWPIAGTLFLNVIYFRADSFIISSVRSNFEVGVYNVAYAIFQAVLVLPTFIMNAYYPMLLRSDKVLKTISLCLTGLGIVAALTTHQLAHFVVKAITGRGFAGSAESLQILSWGFPAYFVSSLLMWLLVVRKRYRPMFALYGLGLVINVILNLIFIPKYSYLAASWITVLSEYLILTLQVVILVR